MSRGHVHHLRLIGVRLQTGPDAGEVFRDAEGRFIRDPSNPPFPVAVAEYVGYIGYPSTHHQRGVTIPPGEAIDTAAHLPRGTVVERGDELEAYDIPFPDEALNGRYRIVSVSYGRALVRVGLRRFTA